MPERMLHAQGTLNSLIVTLGGRVTVCVCTKPSVQTNKIQNIYLKNKYTSLPKDAYIWTPFQNKKITFISL